jgi:hypothetical protein
MTPLVTSALRMRRVYRVAAPNNDPIRLPTFTPPHCCNSEWIQALTACRAGSMVGAGQWSKARRSARGPPMPSLFVSGQAAEAGPILLIPFSFAFEG